MEKEQSLQEKLEEILAEYPVCEYAFVEIPDIPFREEVRHICRTECPRYGTSWSCPPAVGTVKECRERCAAYDGALIFTTIAEDVDTEDMSAMLATRMDHEEITRQIRAGVQEEVSDTLVLSTESCAICDHCAYPEGPCRHPDRMLPCIESYGILVTGLAEQHGISFLSGSRLVTWFSLILYKTR